MPAPNIERDLLERFQAQHPSHLMHIELAPHLCVLIIGGKAGVPGPPFKMQCPCGRKLKASRANDGYMTTQRSKVLAFKAKVKATNDRIRASGNLHGKPTDEQKVWLDELKDEGQRLFGQHAPALPIGEMPSAGDEARAKMEAAAPLIITPGDKGGRFVVPTTIEHKP